MPQTLETPSLMHDLVKNFTRPLRKIELDKIAQQEEEWCDKKWEEINRKLEILQSRNSAILLNGIYERIIEGILDTANRELLLTVNNLVDAELLKVEEE